MNLKSLLAIQLNVIGTTHEGNLVSLPDSVTFAAHAEESDDWIGAGRDRDNSSVHQRQIARSGADLAIASAVQTSGGRAP